MSAGPGRQRPAEQGPRATVARRPWLAPARAWTEAIRKVSLFVEELLARRR